MEEVYDYAIIGCGITGAYLGYKLNMLCPNKKFLFIDSKFLTNFLFKEICAFI